MPTLPRFESLQISAGMDGIEGDVRQVVIDPFPENVSEVLLYARAWGHMLGDDPDNDNNGFVETILRDGNEIMESLGLRSPEDGWPDISGATTMRKAFLKVWRNEERVKFDRDHDLAFENYDLYCLNQWSTDVPEAGKRFTWTATHWNQWASSDGFDVFVELRIAD